MRVQQTWKRNKQPRNEERTELERFGKKASRMVECYCSFTGWRFFMYIGPMTVAAIDALQETACPTWIRDVYHLE